MGFKKSESIDITKKRDQYSFRFCNFFDDKSRELEEIIRRQLLCPNAIIDDSGKEREISWPTISYWQSYHFLDFQKRPFYLLQMTNTNTNFHHQIVVMVERSKLPLFQFGVSEKWVTSSNADLQDDQIELVRELLYFCKNHTPLISLRIQSYIPQFKTIEKTYENLYSLGFHKVAPRSYVKTRMIDLRPPIDEIAAGFSSNARARLKIKMKDLDEVEIKDISDLDAVPHLQNALNASYQRSIKKDCPYNFNPLMMSMNKYQKEIIMLGFFFKRDQNFPKAFVTGISHCHIVEFSVGGSMSDQNLRRYPFNHQLMWELAVRFKKNGCSFFDMGGISSGSENDHLSGITAFKRFFPGFELSVGQEMQKIFKPNYHFLYFALQSVTLILKKAINPNR